MKSRFVKLLLFAFVCFLTPLMGIAQQVKVSNIDLNASFGAGKNSSIASLGLSKNWGLGDNNRLQLGIGFRSNVFRGSNLNYVTADANYTSSKANYDTFNVANPLFTVFNIQLQAELYPIKKLSFGFDIDLLGFGAGPERSGTYIPGEVSSNSGAVATNVKASPKQYNQLIYSDYDLGTLKSSFFIRLRPFTSLSAKIGYNMVFTEYETATNLGANNITRFRNKTGMFFAGLTYHVFE